MQNSGQSQEQQSAAYATIELKDEIKKFIEASKKREESNQRLTYFILALALIQVTTGIITLYSA